jgi:putative spermidine/putrescine transport system substrate-binding protein
MKDASLSTTQFIGIPFNAPNKPAALVLANFLLSVDAQAAKYDPTIWGDLPVLNIKKLKKADQKRFINFEQHETLLPAKTWCKYQTPEIHFKYKEVLDLGWELKVLNSKKDQ